MQVKSSADLGLLGAKQAPAFSGRYKVRACSLQSLPAPSLTPLCCWHRSHDAGALGRRLEGRGQLEGPGGATVIKVKRLANSRLGACQRDGCYSVA